MEKISWTDCVINEVFQSQEGVEYFTDNKNKGEFVASCVGTVF
jgi:hypothetical protein